MKPLTSHQKKVLVALAVMEQSTGMKVTLQSRWQIGSRVYGHAQGIAPSTMISLQRRSLVENDDENAVEYVVQGRCKCGCDRWRLTDAGREMVKTFKVAGTCYGVGAMGPIMSLEDFKKLYGTEDFPQI